MQSTAPPQSSGATPHSRMRESTLYAIVDCVRALCTPYTGGERLPDIYDTVAPRCPEQPSSNARAKDIVEEELADMRAELQKSEVAEIDDLIHAVVQRSIAAIYSRLTEIKAVAVPQELCSKD